MNYILSQQSVMTHDFELISFDFQTGNIMISKLLNEEDRRLTNINGNMKLDEELMTDGRREYLIWHNNNFLSGKNFYNYNEQYAIKEILESKFKDVKL